MKYPKISVIVPAYKEEETIGNALEYLVKKIKYPNLEIIIGIDTDEDKTHEIAKKYAKKYKRIKIDFSPKRRGTSAAENDLIKRATGDIIVKNDADIRLGNPSKVLFQVAKLYEDPKVGGLSFRVRDSLESEKRKSMISRGEIFVQRLVYDWFTQKHPVIEGKWDMPLICNSFRKKLIPKINPRIMADDIEFGYRIIEQGYKLLFPDIPYYPIGLPKDSSRLFLQKRRSTIALMRIAKRRKIKYGKFYSKVFLYFLSNIYKYSLKDIAAFFYWGMVYTVSIAAAHRKKSEKRTKIYVKYKREPKF
ncbi:MAG: glycosyltransferase [Candidatus Aenigmarchaeota archaeon]|nr:glycosyltransferase [Candidatus Aenigmarchaeota archaeon]